MNNTDMLFVQKKLNDLVGCALLQLSRMSDMLCLTFGQRDPNGGTVVQSLHLQCYYRLILEEELLLARSDYFQPSQKMWNLWNEQGLPDDLIPDDYRCDDPGANRLDDRIEDINSMLTRIGSHFLVRTLLVNSIGDMTLCFENGAILNVLVDTSGGEECWRYLSANGDAPELILYSDGVEYE